MVSTVTSSITSKIVSITQTETLSTTKETGTLASAVKATGRGVVLGAAALAGSVEIIASLVAVAFTALAKAITSKANFLFDGSKAHFQSTLTALAFIAGQQEKVDEAFGHAAAKTDLNSRLEGIRNAISSAAVTGKQQLLNGTIAVKDFALNHKKTCIGLGIVGAGLVAGYYTGHLQSGLSLAQASASNLVDSIKGYFPSLLAKEKVSSQDKGGSNTTTTTTTTPTTPTTTTATTTTATTTTATTTTSTGGGPKA